jgi:hypothetical protein
MPVGHAPSKRYFSISKKGKIRYKDYNENKEYLYDYIEGILTRIELVEDTYEGEVITKWHLYLEDRDHSQIDVLQVGEASSAARSIITSLYCTPGQIGHIKISPYLKKVDGTSYTNVWYEHEGETVDWDKKVLEAVPDVEEVMVGSKRVLDDSERRKFFRALASQVKKKKLNTRPEPQPEAPRGQQPPATPEPANNEKRKSGPGNDASTSDPIYQQKQITDEELNTVDWDDMGDDDLPF